MPAGIDENRAHSLLAVDIVSGKPLPISGLNLINGQALVVALVDGAGSQVTNFATSGITLKPYDYVSRTLLSATETWTFKTGGSGGTTTNTIVIVYTDTTLSYISTVTKT